MLLFVSDRRGFSRIVSEYLHENGVILFRCYIEAAEFFCEQKDISSVIIDCEPHMRRAQQLCAKLQELYPEMPIATIAAKTSRPSLCIDHIFRDDNMQLLYENLMTFCRDCGWNQQTFSSYYLTVGFSSTDIRYMGYPLHLSHREHQILRCLFYRSPKYTTSQDLMSLCYPRGTETMSNLCVMIHRINKSAAKIDPRPLIVNAHALGYRLRDGILPMEK